MLKQNNPRPLSNYSRTHTLLVLTRRLHLNLRALFSNEMDAQATIAMIEGCVRAYRTAGKWYEAKKMFCNILTEKSVINSKVSNMNALLEGYCTLSIRAFLYVAMLFDEHAMVEKQILALLQPLQVTTLNFAADLRLLDYRLQKVNESRHLLTAVSAPIKMVLNLSVESSAAELMQLISYLFHSRYQPHCQFLVERSVQMPFFQSNTALTRTRYDDIVENIWHKLMQKMEHISVTHPIEIDEVDYVDFRNRCFGRVYNFAFSMCERLDNLYELGLLIIRPEPSKLRP